MNNELLSVPAQITKVSTMADKGLQITVHTQEIASFEDAATLLKLKGSLGYFLFKTTNISETDVVSIPNEIKEFKTDRTPSERLRAVLYRYWEQTGGKETFQQFYSRHIEDLVEQYKSKLSN